MSWPETPINPYTDSLPALNAWHISRAARCAQDLGSAILPLRLAQGVEAESICAAFLVGETCLVRGDGLTSKHARASMMALAALHVAIAFKQLSDGLQMEADRCSERLRWKDSSMMEGPKC